MLQRNKVSTIILILLNAAFFSRNFLSVSNTFGIYVNRFSQSTSHKESNEIAVTRVALMLAGGVVLDTLEEWRLVFFGTDASVEVDDELDKDKPLPPVIQEEVNNAPSDVRHNAVDTEGDPWTGSRKMDRVSHPEVQRPTTENQTNGCAAFEAGGSGCLGGCLILFLLAYLTSVPSWRELITSWPASTNSRSELGTEANQPLIAAAEVVSITTATSWVSDTTTRRVPAAIRPPEACRCT